jgi:hypothetical protein
MDNLDNAEAHICHLEGRIREMEEELAGPHKYKDHQGSKRAQYDSSNGTGSGVALPAPLAPVGEAYAPSSQRESGRIQMVPTAHIEEDVQMEDGEVAFLPLPRPAPPMAETIKAPQFQCGANWMPAPVPRGMPGMHGSPFGRPMPRHTRLVIPSMEELEQHLEVANTPHNKLAVTYMYAYI